MLKKMITHIYFILGIFFLILTIIGLLLPLVPATPFVLIAIYFFDRSSQKFHKLCLKIPFLGNGIQDWNQHRVIRKSAKWQVSLLLAFSAGTILLRDSFSTLLKIGVLVPIAIIWIFIMTRRSEPKCHSINSSPSLEK